MKKILTLILILSFAVHAHALDFGDGIIHDIQADPIFTLKWIFPTRKDNVGSDFHIKTDHLFYTCLNEGHTEEQATLTQGLVDHESGGTWDKDVRNCNSNECSTGIAQWNRRAGRYAPPTFDEQAELICKEMKWKFDHYPTNLAITAHNAPAMASYGVIKWNYVNYVLRSAKQFN